MKKIFLMLALLMAGVTCSAETDSVISVLDGFIHISQGYTKTVVDLTRYADVMAERNIEVKEIIIGETKLELNDSGLYEKSFDNWNFYYPHDYDYYTVRLKLGTTFDRTVRVTYTENNSEDIIALSEPKDFKNYISISADTYSSFASLFVSAKKHGRWKSLKVMYMDYNNEQHEVDVLSSEFDGWVHELKWNAGNSLRFIGESIDGMQLDESCSASTRNPLVARGRYGSYSSNIIESYTGIEFNDAYSYVYMFPDEGLNFENSATKYYIGIKCAQDLSKCVEIDGISIISDGSNKGNIPFEVVNTIKHVNDEYVFIALNTNEYLYEPTVTVRFRLASASQTSNYYEMKKDLKGEKNSVTITSLSSQDVSDNCARVYAGTNLENNECETGFEWRKYDAPDLVPSQRQQAYVNEGKMTCLIENLDASSYYKYRPYAIVYGNEIFGNWMAFGTTAQHQGFLPIVNTISVTNVTDTTATVCGYFIGGSEPMLEHGFICRIEDSEQYDVFPTTTQQAVIHGLKPASRYSVQAYVKTDEDTVYGETLSFETTGESDPDASIEESLTENVEKFSIYNLQGVCVKREAVDFSGITPGIYIARGKKVLVP